MDRAERFGRGLPPHVRMKKWLPWLVLALFTVWVLAALRSPRESSEYHTADFGRLPAVLNGRLQPLDSVARNALLVMRGKQSVALDGGGQLSAIGWLMEVTMKPEVADTRRVFRVDHPELRGLLKLPLEGSNYFPFTELQGSLEEIEKQARRANGVEAATRSTFEKAVLKLHFALNTYQRLKNSLRPENSTDFAADLRAYREALAPGIAAVRLREQGKEFNREDFDRLLKLLRNFDAMANVAYPLIVPPVHPEMAGPTWSNLGTSLMESLHTEQIHPAAEAYATMATAYRQAKPAEFNQALAGYRQWLAGQFQPQLDKGWWEFLFNSWRPFVKSIAIYTLVFLLGCASWFGWFQGLNRTAGYLLGLGFVVHTAGIVFRMALEGRPPVTNLYSSAVFVGWGAVGLGLILERLHRDSIGIVMSSALGLTTLIVAHNLSLDGDTMEMLRAVLDTNFWLATHVITITLGYSAMFVAGFLAALYIVRGVFTRSLGPETRQALSRMVYGIVCFATLFNFVGTILGGIWADQSWGRFWGWDPKENGALIIVLWCAILLHARWGGLVRERGLMNLAIFGNIVTSFSWFGVNMLGVGLHSYGFMDKAFVWLMLFVVSQLALIGLGLLPDRFWASLRTPLHPRPARAS